MMVTALRCWWQNDFADDFFTMRIIGHQHLKVANKKRFQQKTLPTSMLPIHNYDQSKLVMLLVKLNYHMVHEILHLKFFFGRSIFGLTRFLSIIWRHRFYCNIIFANEDTGYREVVTKILMVNTNGTLLSQKTKLIDPIIGFERN